MVGSLAYRTHAAEIARGVVPGKYLRLLPHIPGSRILELGSAEGVLALLLARDGREVTAVERSPERHETALRLCDAWAARFGVPRPPRYVNADIAGRVDLLEGVDTLVAVRMIYYLGAALDPVFAEVARQVPCVVLCGNRGRAEAWRSGVATDTRADNYYASPEGMRDLLGRHGYRIAEVVSEGDPIVVGRA